MGRSRLWFLDIWWQEPTDGGLSGAGVGLDGSTSGLWTLCRESHPRHDRAMTVNRKMESLSEAEAWATARRAEVGRLAVIVDDHPEIFPVNYIVDRGSIVLRTSAGTKLAGSVGRAVAFEVDGFDAESGDAWSVMIKGVARELTGLYEVLDAMELPLHTWHPTPKSRILRIEPTEITGRRFPRAGTSAARVVPLVPMEIARPF